MKVMMTKRYIGMVVALIVVPTISVTLAGDGRGEVEDAQVVKDLVGHGVLSIPAADPVCQERNAGRRP